MKFAYDIPDSFWSLFRSMNRELYMEALLKINEEYEYNNYYLSKEVRPGFYRVSLLTLAIRNVMSGLFVQLRIAKVKERLPYSCDSTSEATSSITSSAVFSSSASGFWHSDQATASSHLATSLS